MAILRISVDFEDDSELDYNRDQLVGAVEDKIEDMKEQKRIEEDVEISWDIAD